MRHRHRQVHRQNRHPFNHSFQLRRRPMLLSRWQWHHRRRRIRLPPQGRRGEMMRGICWTVVWKETSQRPLLTRKIVKTRKNTEKRTRIVRIEAAIVKRKIATKKSVADQKTEKAEARTEKRRRTKRKTRRKTKRKTRRKTRTR